MFERLERELLFPATARRGDARMFDRLTDAERIWLDRDGDRVECWLLRAPALSGAPLVVFAHGNGELIDDWAAPMARLRDRGVHVGLVEYRGYGRSEGVPAESAIVGDFEAGVARLKEVAGVTDDRIVYLGRSLGGGVMCGLAAIRPPALLVLASTFRSVPSLAKSLFGIPGFVITNRFDNEAMLRTYDGPLHISHGTHDELIPYAHAEALLAARGEGTLLSRPCGHNDWPLDWEDWLDELTEAMARQGIPTG